MNLDDVLNDQKPRPDSVELAAAGGVGAVESLEQAVGVFAFDSETFVFSMDDNVFVPLFGGQAHGLVGVGYLMALMTRLTRATRWPKSGLPLYKTKVTVFFHIPPVVISQINA